MRALACLVSLCLAACATSSGTATSPTAGESGPLTWGISDIGRVLSEDNQRVRWSYLITLRNTTDRVIQLQSMERALASGSPESVGGTPTSQAFRRTIGARGELRVSTSDSWGWIRESNRTFGGAATLRPVTAYRTFSGTDDQGKPIQVRVRIQLDPSVGPLAKPPVAPARLPAPTSLGSDGLTSIVGVWRGSYRVDGTLLNIPFAATILADGTVKLAENDPATNHFDRRVQIKDDGLEYAGSQERGTLQLYELVGRRMLVGRVLPVEGWPYAVYLEAEAPLSMAAQPATTSGPPLGPIPVSTPPAGAVANPMDLSGSYRGTVTGTRSDNSSYSDRVTVAVVQAGREFSGTWSTPAASGTLTGTVLNRTSFTFRLRQDSPCAAEFGGLGAIDESGTRLAASYRGGSCQGLSVAASLVVTREPR